MNRSMQFNWITSTKYAPPALACDGGTIVATAIAEFDSLDLSQPITAFILDVPSLGSEQSFRALRQAASGAPVLVYDPARTHSSARWLEEGAACVTSGCSELESRLETFRLASTEKNRRTSSLLGNSRTLRSVADEIAMISARRCNVLIEGETGTGKEVAAREIHTSGDRSRGPWIALNCSAIPEALLEAELFGYARGAFTGAVQAHAGKFEAANHGTLFLDEIGDMPLAIQAKLLRVLQERELERLGTNERIKLDVRVIAATNVNLAEKVREGTFRQDLYYRLNVFRIVLPALRERTDDIPLLAQHFVDRFCAAEHLPGKALSAAAIGRLQAHAWPGNVRELENAMESCVIVSGARTTISATDLRIHESAAPPRPESSASIDIPPQGLDYQQALEQFEKSLLTQALTRARGNKTAAAELLGLKRTTLAAKMKVLEGRLPRLVA